MAVKSMIAQNVEVSFWSAGAQATRLEIVRRSTPEHGVPAAGEQIVLADFADIARLRDFLDACIEETNPCEERYELFSDCFLTFPRPQER